MAELTKGKVFKLLEDNVSEDTLREYININGKKKPYCPIWFRPNIGNQDIEQENGDEQ